MTIGHGEKLLLSVLLASPLLNGVCLLVQCYGMIMTLQMPPRCALKRGASRLITMTIGALRAGAGSGHRRRDDRDDFLITNEKLGGFDFPQKCRQMDGVSSFV